MSKVWPAFRSQKPNNEPTIYQITGQSSADFSKVGKLSPFSMRLRILISSRFYILPLGSRSIDVEIRVRSVVHAWFILNVNPFFSHLLDLVAVGCFLLAARVAWLFDGQGPAVALPEIDVPVAHFG
jgi:hypothetical protein